MRPFLVLIISDNLFLSTTALNGFTCCGCPSQIPSLCDADADAYAAALPALTDRPWVLDPSLEPIPEYDQHGCAMSVSNIGKKRQAKEMTMAPDASAASLTSAVAPNAPAGANEY